MGLKAVHFGGGNIGRGFVAEKLHLAGYEVVFVDVMDKIIDALQHTKEYKVTEIGGEGEHTTVITNYRAINSKTHEPEVVQEIATADLVTCAVGPNILKFIAPVIGKGIEARTAKKPLAVIACENAIGATTTLQNFIQEEPHTPAHRLDSIRERAIFANSAIDRIVPAQDPDAGLDVKIETFFEWVVEKTPWEPDHEHPVIDAVKWVDDLEPFIERKLFTVNTSHAAAAYHGHQARKASISDVMEDAALMETVRHAVEETSNLIVRKHSIDASEQAEYVEKILSRISNPYLKDSVERVGRAPLRKLGRKERFVGPAAELAEEGKDVTFLLSCIEMAFRFQNVEGDDESFELGKIMESKKAPEIVQSVCGLTEKDKLYPMVVKVVEKVQASQDPKL